MRRDLKAWWAERSTSDRTALLATLIIWVAMLVYLFTSAGCSGSTPC